MVKRESDVTEEGKGNAEEWKNTVDDETMWFFTGPG